MDSSMMRRRILALWLPRLPTDRLKRLAKSAPDGDTPLVIAGRASNALFVYALNRGAQQLGLYRGQPLANARAMIENLAVVAADERADLALLDNIADWCDRFTPLVATDSPDGIFLASFTLGSLTGFHGQGNCPGRELFRSSAAAPLSLTLR